MPPNAAILTAGAGNEKQPKYTPLFVAEFIGGLETQRSPFTVIDNRYNKKFLGGKPATLIAGSNCEITNRLTLQRRYGLLPYGVTSVPAPTGFYNFESQTPASLQLVVDTQTGVYLYTPTNQGLLYAKKTGAGQGNFVSLNDTLYICDGVSSLKYIGPNLLKYSDTLDNGVWTQTNLTSVTGGSADPFGGTSAYTITPSGASSQLTQTVVPPSQLIPLNSNTFTFSVWLLGTPTLNVYIIDQAANTVALTTMTLTGTWTRYQATGTTNSGCSSLKVIVEQLGTSTAYKAYGAQLEVGGPATGYQATTNLPQGMYKWTIAPPVTAPTLGFSNVGNAWASTHGYSLTNTITDSNGNQQTVTTAGTSGGTEPLANGASPNPWATQQNSTTVDGSVTWTNTGPAGLSPKTGYRYYYAGMSSMTGSMSTASPVSADSGPLIGQSVTVTGDFVNEPQCDQIMVFRNTDGGPFFNKLTTVANPGSGTWSYADTIQDTGLNAQIYAPLAQFNNPPPAGFLGPVLWGGRYWGFVGQQLYFSTGADNASLLNVALNGVLPEMWNPSNVFPMPNTIVRLIPTAGALFVLLVDGFWAITGTNLTNFFPSPVFANVGLRNYNALDFDGSTIHMYTSDRQFLAISPSGVIEAGYPIGDSLETTFNPTTVCVVRHISGSQDNAVFLANGTTGWYRGNPNQVGADTGNGGVGVWSPFATITGGSGVIASIETVPGVHKLLVGGTGTGVVLYRDLSTFSDNGTAYTWNATIGSLVLCPPGELVNAESITVESLAATPTVAVLLNEVSGTFVSLTNSASDPIQLPASSSINSNRWQMATGTQPPLCRHLQIKLSGVAATTKDEILSFTIRGLETNEEG